MNVLAIECSHPSASLCLYSHGQIVETHQWHALRNHDEYLFPALESCLDHLNEEPLDLILLGAGPGSYGGVRVAIAAATGLQMVLGSAVVSIDSWQQLAHEGEAIVSDAKRGAWTYRHPSGLIEIKSTEELLELQAQGLKFSTLEDEPCFQALGLRSERYLLSPQAKGLIDTWFRLSSAQQDELRAQAPSPIYVRPPHITKAKRKPWER